MRLGEGDWLELSSLLSSWHKAYFYVLILFVTRELLPMFPNFRDFWFAVAVAEGSSNFCVSIIDAWSSMETLRWRLATSTPSPCSESVEPVQNFTPSNF